MPIDMNMYNTVITHYTFWVIVWFWCVLLLYLVMV